jgi:hypothetical protein
MVKLYELRIGNFFYIQLPPSQKKQIKEVKEIRQKHVLLDGVWYHLDELIPIPLTEDILLKCGFTKFEWIKESNVFQGTYFNCKADENGVQPFGVDLNNLKPVKYLHEFQNLFSQLTETELNVHFTTADLTEGEQEEIRKPDFVVLSSND